MRIFEGRERETLSMLALIPIALGAIAGVRSLWSPCGLSVAETTYLPVRGVRRAMVLAFLVVAGAMTGGGLGALLGWAWVSLRLPQASPFVVFALVMAALALDLLKVRPLAVGRQLPTAWGRIFGPEGASLLYGARLGIAPATILMTWLWYAATIVAMTEGPLVGAVTGVVFQVARIATICIAVSGASDAVPQRMTLIQRSRGFVAAGLGLMAGLIGFATLAI